jgi:hypothetical protein
MAETNHRSCECGAVYSRIEAMAPSRQIASFECLLCGSTLETLEHGMDAIFSAGPGPVRISGRSMVDQPDQMRAGGLRAERTCLKPVGRA